MSKSLSLFLEQNYRLTNSEISDFISQTKSENFLKNELLLGKGEICQTLWFLESGSIRQFYINKNLDEVNTQLVYEGQCFTDVVSFTTQAATESNLQAFSESKVLSISVHALHKLIAKSQSYLQLGKILDSSRLIKYRSDQSPESRYQLLMQSEPELLQAFPLKQIASYLNMTPETLSRVRKRISTLS